MQTEQSLRLIVAISQKETLIFKSEDKGTVPEHLHPFDPHGVLHHLNRSAGRDQGSREPENLKYYEAIAKTLTDANQILLLGSGTGASNAMSHVQDYLSTHHPAISKAIVGALTVDIQSLSEGEILKEARAFFATLDHKFGVSA